MKHWMPWLLLLLALLAWDAPAQTRAGLLKQVEATMLLTGHIDVAADGTVTRYAIDREGDVRPEVLAHVARHVANWEVSPAMAGGVPVASSSRFSLRLRAYRHDNETFRFNIEGVHIEDDLPEDARVRSRGGLRPPRYPMTALRAGGTGIVYAVVNVDRAGKVVATHLERVDLTVLASDRLATATRAQLSGAVLEAASKWEFDVPTTGPHAGLDHYSIRVPVEFILDDQPAMASQYGKWSVYLPGAYTRAPWRTDDEGGNIAAVPGRPMLAGSGMRLLSGFEPGEG